MIYIINTRMGREATVATVGIIAEYNPLHNGHVHHFTEAKEYRERTAPLSL